MKFLFVQMEHLTGISFKCHEALELLIHHSVLQKLKSLNQGVVFSYQLLLQQITIVTTSTTNLCRFSLSHRTQTWHLIGLAKLLLRFSKWNLFSKEVLFKWQSICFGWQNMLKRRWEIANCNVYVPHKEGMTTKFIVPQLPGRAMRWKRIDAGIQCECPVKTVSETQLWCNKTKKQWSCQSKHVFWPTEWVCNAEYHSWQIGNKAERGCTRQNVALGENMRFSLPMKHGLCTVLNRCCHAICRRISVLLHTVHLVYFEFHQIFAAFLVNFERNRADVLRWFSMLMVGKQEYYTIPMFRSVDLAWQWGKYPKHSLAVTQWDFPTSNCCLIWTVLNSRLFSEEIVYCEKMQLANFRGNQLRIQEAEGMSATPGWSPRRCGSK